MKKSQLLEIIGILSLSLMLLSVFAISSVLPDLMNAFPDYDRASVELLISCPTIAMVIMITLTPVFSKFLNERFMVVGGLLICGGCGITPFFTTSYDVILISRFLMGIGIGLLNAKAVSLIGERFTGDLRLQLMGIRCSMETIGQSVMIFAVGQLLRFGWNYAFLIHGVCFVILIMFVAFVPSRKKLDANESLKQETPSEPEKVKLRPQDKKVVFGNFALGIIIVSSAVIISLRLTSYIVEQGIGTSVDGANILSISVFAGFLGGMLFGKLMQKIGNLVLPLSLFTMGVGMAAISTGLNLPLVAFGACAANCFITVGTSYMFNSLSEHLPVETLNTANSMVLIGCNLGSCTISFILSMIALINPELSFAYLCYAVVLFVLAIVFFVKNIKRRKCC